jgi:hypothetical protein
MQTSDLDIPGHPKTMRTSDFGYPGTSRNDEDERFRISRDIPKRWIVAISDMNGSPERSIVAFSSSMGIQGGW